MLKKFIETPGGQIHRLNRRAELNPIVICKPLSLVGDEGLVIDFGTVGRAGINNLVGILNSILAKVSMEFRDCFVGEDDVIVGGATSADHVGPGKSSALSDSNYKSFCHLRLRLGGKN